MQLKMHYFIVILVSFAFMMSVKAMGQQLISFDGQHTKSLLPGPGPFRVEGRSGLLEKAEGIKGMGYRTDGYSSYLKSMKQEQKQTSGISGWFALESFPTDTAAFFALRDSVKNISVGLCVDRYGSLLLSVGKDNQFSYHPLNQFFERLKWYQLLLNLDSKKPEILVNGQSVPLPDGLPQEGTRFNQMLIAKDYRDMKLGRLDLTIINGLVDELRIWNGIADEKLLKSERQAYARQVPKLAIPSSRFKNDFNRPRYHLLPAANWTNETHGLIYYKGLYHIFNQKNASSLALRQINWGHFSSPDLIHWTEHRPALSPEPGYDENGIWSGHVVLDEQQVPLITYTAGGPRMGIGLAFPKDSTLVDWTKYKENPVVPHQPEGFTRTDLRDTYVWRERDKWYMIVGFGMDKGEQRKGALLLYSSNDLRNWSFLHTLFEGVPEKDGSGVFWEMPVFKKIGSKYILLVNKVPDKAVPARALYWVGDFVNERFVPDEPVPQNLEVINRLLSPSVAEDRNGLLTAIAIIPDEISSEAAWQQGWNHLYSIPRVWTLVDGALQQSPHPVMEKLRGSKKMFPKVSISAKQTKKVSEGQHQYELLATIDPGDARKFGFILHKNPDQLEYTRIYYDVDKKEMITDQTHSSLRKGIPLRIRKDKFELDLNKPVTFHMFVDGSVVEVFINNKSAFTTRIFPARESSNLLEIFAEGGIIQTETQLWKLNPAPVNADF